MQERFINNPLAPLNAFDICQSLPFGKYILVCKTNKIFKNRYETIASILNPDNGLDLYLSQYDIYPQKQNKLFSLLKPLIKKYGFRFTVVVSFGEIECYYLFKKTFITNIIESYERFLEYENSLRAIRTSRLKKLDELKIPFEKALAACSINHRLYRLLYINKITENMLNAQK